jgi:transcriptional regulator with XRE-family HTH domain
MTAIHGPTVGRRRLRAALRTARDAAGLTQEQVAAAMDWSLSKLIRIEAGTVSISTNDVKALLDLYRMNDPDEVAELVGLARVARRRTWWSQYKDDLPAPYLNYIGLEAEASALSFFQPIGMPGLMQTEAYARAVVKAVVPSLVDPNEADNVVAVRMRRQQEVLRQPRPPEVSLVLDEAALHRQTGGVSVVREQLLHLVALGSEPNISIRVLPFTASEYTPFGTFIVLGFPDPGVTDVAYVEGAGYEDVVDNPDQVKPFQETFRQLQEQSLDAARSRALIEKVAGELLT